MKRAGQPQRSGNKPPSSAGKGKALASVKPRARRLTPQKSQEGRSKGQLIDRLAEAGWNYSEVTNDLGEDFVVQIYDAGKSTGLSFYIQLKSYEDATRYEPKRGAGELRYPLEVKDLEHWERQTVPVALVVWDVTKRQGYWQMIPKIIDELDGDFPGWRDKKKVRVSVPLRQGTEDDGLRQLRWAVADRLMPLVPKKGSLTLNLSFPPTPEGQAASQALVDALDTGEEAIIGDTFIASISLPGWHERVYGALGKPDSVTLVPVVPDKTIPVRIQLETHEGSFALPYIELGVTRMGRKRITLTNQRHPGPIMVTLSLDRVTNRTTVTLERVGPARSLSEEREILGCLLAQNQSAHRILIIDLRRGKTLLQIQNSAEPSLAEEVDSLRRYFELIEKLSFIQSRLGAADFTVPDALTHAQASLIDDVFAILREGRVERVRTLKVTVNPTESGASLEPWAAKDEVEFYSAKEDAFELLGVQVFLGRMRTILKEPAQFITRFREATREARRTQKPVEVSFKDLPVIQEYLAWLPRESARDRLHEVASVQGGYFTLEQALHAGYASADILEAEERVERHGDDVFKLAQFPASEHEELLLLWLQTGRHGVISHDTALSLHGLSGILPARLHITVPPRWSPGERTLGDHVDVHRADVEASDVTWVGPVPVTRPLRTLVDCIDAHLPPDLLDQAIDEAFQRGMIGPADVQHLRAARARSA